MDPDTLKLIQGMTKTIKEEEEVEKEKERQEKYDKEYCGYEGYDFVDTPGKSLIATCEHQYTGWIKHQLICGTCGVILKENKILKNAEGYGFVLVIGNVSFPSLYFFTVLLYFLVL